MVAAAVICIALAALGFFSLNRQIKDFQRVPVPGRAEVSSTRPGGHVLYLEKPGQCCFVSVGSGGSPRFPSWSTELGLIPVNGGPPVSISEFRDATQTYDVTGHQGQAAVYFTISQPGNYLLATRNATPSAIADITVGRGHRAGMLRLLTGQPGQTEPPLGLSPVLPPQGAPQPGGLNRPVLRTVVVIEAASGDDGTVEWTTWVAGSRLCQQRRPVPDAMARVRAVLDLPPLLAGERLTEAGEALAASILDEPAGQLPAGLLHRLPPGDQVDVVLSAAGRALSVPVELARFTTADGVEAGPLALLPGASVTRRPGGPGPGGPPQDDTPASTGVGGPVKVLAAVATPDETKTPSLPLDAEAEMQAVLDTVTGLAGHRSLTSVCSLVAPFCTSPL